jgi:hypothetical protein
MTKRYGIFLVLLKICIFVQGQSVFFLPSSKVPVSTSEGVLTNAWTGGLNSSTIATFDANADGQLDLFVLDRQTNKILVFVSSNGKYKYAPDLTHLFPEMTHYALFYDYNKDGKKDLFTYSLLGIKVYKNMSTGSNIKFSIVHEPLMTRYFTNIVNMDIANMDIPTLADVDADGDMDIVHFRSSSGSTLDLELNIAKESFNRTDTLVSKNNDHCWGGFQELSCKSFLFGFNCKDNFRLEHVGGGGLALFDANNDGDLDIIVGKEDCVNLCYMENKGSVSAPFMGNFQAAFPSSSPVDSLPYPLPFIEDVDFDGIKDLVITMGIPSPTNTADLSSTLWWYKNTGTNQYPTWSLARKNFLQNTMLDLGHNSSSAFADVDGDGDLDLFVAGASKVDKQNARLYLFLNTGTSSSPVFLLVEPDYLSLASKGYDEMSITFADLNNDNKTDLVVTALHNSVSSSDVYYNSAASGLNFGASTSLNITNDLTHSLQFVDLNSDLLMDVLVGTKIGEIKSYTNTGTASSPSFSLSNNQFGGLKSNYASASVAITNLDGNNLPDLLVANDSGFIKLCPDFLSQDPQKFSCQTIATSSSHNRSLGKSLRLASVDIDQDSYPEIIVGNVLGGLQLLAFDAILSSLSSLKPSANDAYFHLFPNPNDGTFEMTTSESGHLEIRDCMGGMIMETEAASLQNMLVLPQSAKAGIYLASFRGKSGQRTCKKMVKK